MKPTHDILSFGLLLFGLESPADPEHVAIRMAEVHLADVPRHIGGRECDLQPGGHALLVHLVHVVHPDRHPDALVALFVSVLLKRGGVCAAAAGLPAPPDKERCKFPYPIQPRQTSEAFPSPHATVLAMSDTFNIGVKPLASIAEEDNTGRTEKFGLLSTDGRLLLR